MELPAIYVIDFEGNTRYGVIEFGVVTVAGGEIADIVSEACQVGNAEAFSILGHTRFTDHGALPFSAHLAFFSKLRRTGYFCAHHASTEDRLLRRYAPCPVYLDDSNKDKSVTSWGPWIDTLLLYKRNFPEFQKHSVKDLINIVGLEDELAKYSQEDETFHRARHDAIATALLLKYFISRFRISSIEFLLVTK